MQISESKKLANLLEWRQVIERQRQSGLSIRAWDSQICGRGQITDQEDATMRMEFAIIWDVVAQESAKRGCPQSGRV